MTDSVSCYWQTVLAAVVDSVSSCDRQYAALTERVSCYDRQCEQL